MRDTVLTKIVSDKKNWIARHKHQQPLDSFRYQLQPSTRNFYHALSNTRTRTKFILECKKASPSKGVIRENFDPTIIAGIYKRYASVLSVLTDEKYFQGTFHFLRQVSTLVNQPVLCKDFIIDPWQIYFARLYQADAVLLILSVLDDDTYCKLVAVAHQLNMGVLTEIMNEEESRRAIALNAKVVGINNRDLRDLSIDLNRTRTIATHLPSKMTVISESGISDHRQIRELSRYVNGFLIGSVFMSEANLDMAVRRVLLGENKVCGLTRAIDAHAAYEAGALYGGLIFISPSPRCVDEVTARAIISGAALHYVGVFRNTAISEVVAIAGALGFAAVQLHGDEDQNYINSLRQQLSCDCQIWKAFDMNQGLPVHDLAQVDRYVLDNGGGSGQSFDWSLLKEMRLNNVILAGGLEAGNCVAAASLGCAGLDFNSGIESSPGIKDHHKLAMVFQKISVYRPTVCDIYRE